MLVELRVGEQRYRAVWEVLEGASVTEVARRFGVSPAKCAFLNRLQLWVAGTGVLYRSLIRRCRDQPALTAAADPSAGVVSQTRCLR